jgi:hypothetical protein
MRIHRRIQIEASAAVVWRCLTEPQLLEQWVSQWVDETPDDSPGTGLGASSTLRLREGGKIVTYRSVVTAWEPERKLAIRLSGGSFPPGMEMDIIYELHWGDRNITFLDYDATIPLKGIAYKLLAPIIWLACVSNARTDLAKLKVLAPSIS